jgi:hypothetical protein
LQRFKHKNQFNLIREAINLLPIKILPMLEQVDFVFDYNPHYLGFNPPDETDDGRKYIDICHYVFSWNTPDNKQVIFLKEKNLKLYQNLFDVIWHEIGHAIHEQLRHYNNNWIPIDDYENDFHECFSCSFVRCLYGDRNKDSWSGNQELQKKYDKRPIEFFNSLFLS